MMRVWLGLAWAGLVVLPWYGLEAPLRAISALQPEALPALWQGRVWLWPLAIPLLMAIPGRPRLLALSGALGLAWLCIEGLAIGHRGWGAPWLGALFGAPGPTQPALGWGAAVYALSCVMLAAIGLARQGWCRGDVFVLGSLLLVVGLIVLFVGFPVVSILTSAVRDNAGGFAPDLFAEKLFNSSIWGLDCLVGTHACGVAWNTLAQATLVGVLATLLGLAFALAALRTNLPLKPLLRLLSLLPVITPPFVIGLALILLFGRAGVVTNFLALHFDIPRSRWIYGMPGITIAQLLAFTPIAFLVLVGVLGAVSPSLEEAAQTLRAGRWHTFRTVTWPLIRPGLANAFLISFIESLADFANPLVIGGNFNVLSTDIFFAVVGAAHDQGRAAVLALVLLAFTLTAFMAQRAWTGSRSYTTVTGKGDAGLSAPLPGPLRAACYATVLPWLVLTVAVYGIIMAGGFVVTFGRDNTPTLDYLWTAFSIERGVGGWFLSGSGWRSFITTMELALIATPVTAALGLLTAYLLNRQNFMGKGAFEFLAMMSFAIPGTVIGISYILAFNVPPVELTGTGLIIVISFVFRNMPVGIRAGIASLSQVDRSLDEASQTLGARSFRTLRLVIVPILRPAIVTAMVYSFVRAMTTVSAVIFLVSGEYNLATVYIVGRADVGEYGVALVYSAVLIVVMAAVLAGISAVVGRQKIGRRGMLAADQPVVVQA
ncbi:ABC transporter permease [Limobrevibacterium gyesilva]|uniref:Iron ABC transporter permease n=1 Tax=Limobrevibacterium gyesilva TaxID=2991712 RepID=A0AA41YTV7_9PROT|nr:iron ABC transporter permease [Limobrevibacterium gyesilva]MCW3475332.1 iron ABC transporter permease [Limobrevibacterium gyesilva]